MSTEAIPTGRTQALQRSNMLSASKELSGEKGCVSCISASASSLHSCARWCGSSCSLPVFGKSSACRSYRPTTLIYYRGLHHAGSDAADPAV